MEIDKTQSPRKWKIEKVPRRLIKGHLRDEEFQMSKRYNMSSPRRLDICLNQPKEI